MSSLADFFTGIGLDITFERLDQAEKIFFKVKAKPGSKLEKVQVSRQGELEVFIKAKPVEGAANKALVKYIGKSFGISPSQVELVKGERSKVKSFVMIFTFDEKSPEDFLAILRSVFKL